MIKIVRTTSSHLKKLVEIGKQHWFYEKWLTVRYLRNTIEKKGIHFTALLDNKVVGSIMAVEEDYPKFWLYYFAVNKLHQRRGVGTAMLKSVEAKLRKGEWLFVDLEKNDKTGIKFYLKNGFITMGKVDNWFEGGRKGIILAKRL